VAKYIGKMKAGREYPRLQDHYLMTPNAEYIQFGKEYHPQLKVRASKMFKIKFCANFIACIHVYASSWNMVKKQLGFLVFPSSGNMTRKQFSWFPHLWPFGKHG
jgi:hypothetical protein